MAESGVEEVVVELCRVEVGSKVRKFLKSHGEEFEVDDNSGKVRSKVTGMEFGSTKKGSDNNDKLLTALEQYISGRKYKFAKEAMLARDAAAKYEFLVPHKHHKKWLYCLFCQKQVNMIVQDIENHVNSRKCKFNQTIKTLKRIEGEEGEELVVEEEGEEHSSDEDVEELFFDYEGNDDESSDKDSDEAEDEEEDEDDPKDKSSAGVKKGKKPVKRAKAAEKSSREMKRKAPEPPAASKKRKMK